jgi:hypothetical protein
MYSIENRTGFLAGRDGWMDGEYVEGLTISYVCVCGPHTMPPQIIPTLICQSM